MKLIYAFCSTINLFNWLQNHLLPCPFKGITGFDCPGCGFQRSLIALIQGEFKESWAIYPPTIPLLLMFFAMGISAKFSFNNKHLFQKIVMIFVGNFVLMAYLIKVFK